jgi:hypothetical protein
MTVTHRDVDDFNKVLLPMRVYCSVAVVVAVPSLALPLTLLLP